LWSRRLALTGSFLILGMLLGAFWLSGNPEVKHRWGFLPQVVLLAAGGLHLLLLTAMEAWQRRDTVSAVLAVWIIVGFIFATVLNWTVSARSLLPIVPAAAILVVRRLGPTNSIPTARWRLLWPLIPSVLIGLFLATADFKFANSARTAARRIAAKYESARGHVWFQGHWGFQYYMEKLGGRPVDFRRSTLQPGEVLVVPRNYSNTTCLAPGEVELLETMEFTACSWLSTMDEATGAGFYAADCGPLPFVVGRAPPQKFYLVKVSLPVQFRSPEAMRHRPRRTADGQSSAGVSLSENETRPDTLPEEVRVHARLALQLRSQGNTEEAIRQYREALRLLPDDPILLNNLAWILAADPRSELRDGKEAVRLAARAVELTSRRQATVLGTLAAACAEAGQFSRSIETAEAARDLAEVTGQKEVAATNENLLKLYRAGKAAYETGNR
jgi:hypothetical protein